MPQERLQKIIAAAGVASRRKAEQLITSGAVSVNGAIVTTLGTKADSFKDHIKINGKLLQGTERHVYYVLNKPKEYVTTLSDPEGRNTVMDLMPELPQRVYPVGRLDYHSEGLLILTNDGDLANRLTRAESNVAKVYHVKVSGRPDPASIEKLRHGITIFEGEKKTRRVKTAPAAIRQLKQAENPWFEVVLREGKNRQIRKMFEEIGHHVEKLRRVAFGPVELDIEPGKVRPMRQRELRMLKAAASGHVVLPQSKQREQVRQKVRQQRRSIKKSF